MALVWLNRDPAHEPEPMARAEIIEQYQRAFNVINARLFDGSLPPIAILPGDEYPDATDDTTDAAAIFRYRPDRKERPLIYLQFDNLPEYGIDNDDISSLFHEMIHYFCYERGIEDTEVTHGILYHNESFKKAVEEHGGVSNYIDPEYGHSGELPEGAALAILREL